MGGEEERFAHTGPEGEDVAAAVLKRVEAERAQAAFKFGGDGVLVARGRIDGGQFEKGRDDAVAVNHGGLRRLVA